VLPGRVADRLARPPQAVPARRMSHVPSRRYFVELPTATHDVPLTPRHIGQVVGAGMLRGAATISPVPCPSPPFGERAAPVDERPTAKHFRHVWNTTHRFEDTRPPAARGLDTTDHLEPSQPPRRAAARGCAAPEGNRLQSRPSSGTTAKKQPVSHARATGTCRDISGCRSGFPPAAVPAFHQRAGYPRRVEHVANRPRENTPPADGAGPPR